MDERITRLEFTVEQLRSSVELLQERVAALELIRSDAGPESAVVEAVAGQRIQSRAEAVARDPYDPIVILSLIGRLFLVLAGGFFLRAMTEAGILAVAVGVACALVYGVVWLVLADRAARRRQPTSATFHALGSAMVVFPLLVEATTRFEVLTGSGGAWIIAALTAGFLYVAWRQRLSAIAWITVLAALPTGVILLVKTALPAQFGLYLVALGIATLWAAYVLDWRWPRWLTALVANLVVVGVTVRALSPMHVDTRPVATLLQLSLVFAYLSSIGIRTLVSRRDVSPFDVGQTVAVLAVGIGGSAYLTSSAGGVPAALGVVCLLLGVTSYAVVFARLEMRREGASGANVYYYTTLALVLVLAGLALGVRPRWLGEVFALLAIAGAGLWARYGRSYLLLHGGAYVIGAAVASGAIAYAGTALAGRPDGPWTVPTGVIVFVLAASALTAWLAARRPAPEGGPVVSGLRFLVILVLVWVAGGCVTGYLAPLLAGQADGSADPGALATVRTAVLAVAALLTAWLARRERFREWSWLLYPLLVGIGLKMVVQDFKDSRPATLFMALALYGAALILAPRIRRRSQPPRVQAASSR